MSEKAVPSLSELAAHAAAIEAHRAANFLPALITRLKSLQFSKENIHD